MAKTIEAVDIAGLKVYGRQQVDYTVDGVKGLDYGDAVCFSSFQLTAGIEDQIAAYTAAANRRKEKIQVLGESLAFIAKYNVWGSEDGSDAKNYVDVDTANSLNSKLAQYRLSLRTGSEEDGAYIYITRGAATTSATELQSEVDLEDAELQQITSTLQSIMTKRDDAFSTAESMQKKYANTASSIINGING